MLQKAIKDQISSRLSDGVVVQDSTNTHSADAISCTNKSCTGSLSENCGGSVLRTALTWHFVTIKQDLGIDHVATDGEVQEGILKRLQHTGQHFYICGIGKLITLGGHIKKYIIPKKFSLYV